MGTSDSNGLCENAVTLDTGIRFCSGGSAKDVVQIPTTVVLAA